MDQHIKCNEFASLLASLSASSDLLQHLPHNSKEINPGDLVSVASDFFALLFLHLRFY